MPSNDAIHAALRSAGISPALRSTQNISAGAGQQVIALTLVDNSSLVAKVTPRESGDRLHAEADSLRALREPGILLVPRVHALCDTDTHTALLMDKLEPAPPSSMADDTWARFGRELAAHHQSTPPAPFGWHRNNFLGPTPQPNADQSDDWVYFNATSRIGYQVELAKLHGHLTARESGLLHRVIDRLPNLIPRHPAPALIHGDLWSGNAIATIDSNTPRIAVIDPAVSIGDAWADIAMMQLFGPFPKPCLDAYMHANPDHDRLESRIGVYQLYHTLNHLNIFGTSYKNSALSIARTLLAM